MAFIISWNKIGYTSIIKERMIKDIALFTSFYATCVEILHLAKLELKLFFLIDRKRNDISERWSGVCYGLIRQKISHFKTTFACGILHMMNTKQVEKEQVKAI